MQYDGPWWINTRWDHRVSTGVWVVFFYVKALEKEAIG